MVENFMSYSIVSCTLDVELCTAVPKKKYRRRRPFLSGCVQSFSYYFRFEVILNFGGLGFWQLLLFERNSRENSCDSQRRQSESYLIWEVPLKSPSFVHVFCILVNVENRYLIWPNITRCKREVWLSNCYNFYSVYRGAIHSQKIQTRSHLSKKLMT